jgi:hypothetical protein
MEELIAPNMEEAKSSPIFSKSPLEIIEQKVLASLNLLPLIAILSRYVDINQISLIPLSVVLEMCTRWLYLLEYHGWNK